jgi:serine/threonine protein kinase
MVGKSLSHYKITAELGRRGMGIVYKAEDTNLHHSVAIKVLPPQITLRSIIRKSMSGGIKHDSL